MVRYWLIFAAQMVLIDRYMHPVSIPAVCPVIRAESQNRAIPICVAS